MREWTRASMVTKCGYCGQLVAAGAPLLVLSRHLAWKKYRCVACAGVPVPEFDAPITDVGEDRKTRIESIRQQTWSRFSRQSLLIREPGEEG